MRLAPPFAVLLLAASCPNTGSDDLLASQAPPNIDVELFASLGSGATKLLADASNARVEIDPTLRDPLTALGECADLLSYCYAPPQTTLSSCFKSVRVCESNEPWREKPCCPSACATAFEAEVAAGLTELQALEKVLFREPDCAPQVRAALEGK